MEPELSEKLSDDFAEEDSHDEASGEVEAPRLVAVRPSGLWKWGEDGRAPWEAHEPIPSEETTQVGAPAARRFGRLIGSSPAMKRLYPLLERLAQTDIPVLVEGETGTGKSLLGEVLHELSARSRGPLVHVSTTFTDPLDAEVALFGMERMEGDEVIITPGAFEQADGGTLVLDNVDELPSTIQAKLVRVLDQGEYTRVHASVPVTTDVRVIATTTLGVARDTANFRTDLLYRLAVARVSLPPLRQRGNDVATLAQHFWRVMAETTPPVDLLVGRETYGWPGNVRELHNVVALRLQLGKMAPLPDPAAAEAADGFERIVNDDLPYHEARACAIAEFERIFVKRVLARAGGNVSRAAASAGVTARYLRMLRSRHAND